MGYLFLAAVLAAGGVKGFCGKKQSMMISGTRPAAIVSLLRFLISAAVGFLLVLAGGGLSSLMPDARLLGILILSGAANAVMLLTWLLAVQRSAYVLLDVFATVGVIVPLTVCRILFDERVRPIQWAGFILLCCAAAVMCSYSMRLKKKRMSAADLALLCVFGLSNGTGDLTQKLYMHTAEDGSPAVFNFYTFVFAGAALALSLFFIPRRESDVFPIRRVWGYILVMSLTLFAVNYCKTAAAGVLDAMQIYPILQGGILVINLLVASFFFGEKLTKQSILGMTMCFGAMLLINVL